MRILDSDSGELRQVQLYLSASETRQLVDELPKLLENTEANEHFHLFSEDEGTELSCSVVTVAKLAAPGYTAEERLAFGQWKPRQ